jgi:hypothetical protein
MWGLNSQMHRVVGVMIVLCLANAGCATTTTHRLYHGDRPLDQVATVIWDGSVRPLVLAIDGQVLPQAKISYNRAEILPGPHEFTIAPIGVREIQVREGDSVRFQGVVEAGRCYRASQTYLGSQRAGDREVLRYSEPRLLEIREQPCTMR